MARSTEDNVGDLARFAARFARSLRGERKSEKTIKTYLEAVSQLDDFLAANDLPTTVAGVGRDELEQFMEHLVGAFKPATANNRFRGLQQFFNYLVDLGEIDTSPMAKMKPPRVPETPVPVLHEDELRRLFATCKGKTFEDRRDLAILLMFASCGLRLAEMAGITRDDVDFDDQSVTVLGKGGRRRSVAFGAKLAKALDFYDAVREKHRHAHSPGFWLGPRGPMSDSGIRQIVERRALQAGLGHVWPHQLRHSAVHHYLDGGGQERDAMRTFGWRSPQMLGRYAASTADERARAAQRRLALDERFG